MRVKPSIGIGIGLAIAYMVVFGGLFKLSGVGYDDIAASSGNVIKAIVIPVGVALILFAAVTTFFGWWKPVLRDRRAAGGWLIAFPIFMAIGLVLAVDYGNMGKLGSGLILWIGIGTALVGLSEELVYRGLVIVSFRSSMREAQVWLWSSVAFAALHSINYFLGQAFAATVKQVALTFVVGSGMYIARRATGMIIVPMVLHAAWDFATFTRETPAAGSGLGSLVQILIIVVIVIVLIVGRHRLFASAGQTLGETAEAASA